MEQYVNIEKVHGSRKLNFIIIHAGQLFVTHSTLNINNTGKNSVAYKE